MTAQPRSVTIHGQRLRFWLEPDNSALHIKVLWKQAPTVRQAARGFLAAQHLVDHLSKGAVGELRIDFSKFQSAADDGRHDVTFTLPLGRPA